MSFQPQSYFWQRQTHLPYQSVQRQTEVWTSLSEMQIQSPPFCQKIKFRRALDVLRRPGSCQKHDLVHDKKLREDQRGKGEEPGKKEGRGEWSQGEVR